jgi:Dna[CI] antecedent DciA-like protein
VDSLGRLLPRVLAKQPGSRPLVEARARMALAELLGPGLGEQLAGVELRGSKLSVSTPNPALAHQLRLDADSVLQRLNAAGLGRMVRELQVRIGAARPLP